MEINQSPKYPAEGAPKPASPRRGEGEGGNVRSIQRAFDLLECLDAVQPQASLTDFTRMTGLATTTVKRQLDTLEGQDILRRLPDGRYTHGTRLIRIAVSALQGIEPYDLVEPHLNDLSAKTGETANFGILGDDGNVLYVRQTVSAQAIRHASWLGRTFPSQGTAVGAALLGRATEAGIVSTRQTLEPDVTAVAAPVHGANGAITGAISITGPTFRIDEAALDHFERLLAAHAFALTMELGGTWPYQRPTEPEDKQ